MELLVLTFSSSWNLMLLVTFQCLPLRDSDKPLNVESYETVRFFKCGPDIFLVHRNKFYDPLVKVSFFVDVIKVRNLFYNYGISVLSLFIR